MFIILMFLHPSEQSQAGEQDQTTSTRIYEPTRDLGLMAALGVLGESGVYEPPYYDGFMAIARDDEVPSARELNLSLIFEEIHAHQPPYDDGLMTVAGGDEMSISREDSTLPTPAAPIPDKVAGIEEQRDTPGPSDDELMTITQEIDVENAIHEVVPTSMVEEDRLQEVAKVVRKPRKRARKTPYDGQAQDPRRFLDMEAEVSHDEQDEGQDDDEDDDFINDASSESGEDAPMFIPDSKASLRPNDIEDGLDPGEDEWGSEEEILEWDNDPAIASHDEVFQLMSTEEANYAWLSYLEEERRQREREQQDRERYPYDRHWYPDPVPDTVPTDLIPDSIVPLIPRPSHDKFLWRVAVKVSGLGYLAYASTHSYLQRGREEALAFILYSKAMKGNFKVKSVVGRVSCPGWIYIEAKNLIDVQQICEEVRDIHIRKIYQ
ncbi:hypothetical protein H0H92_006870, partial [Tricholoma furcatifolium]